MSASDTVGKLGEQIAADYLLGLGYEILERNYRIGHLELDIVARHEESIRIVEVKTRSCSPDSVGDFMPEAAMNAVKKERLMRATERYLTQYNRDEEVFLELIAINISRDEHRLRHYKSLQWD